MGNINTEVNDENEDGNVSFDEIEEDEVQNYSIIIIIIIITIIIIIIIISKNEAQAISKGEKISSMDIRLNLDAIGEISDDKCITIENLKVRFWML